MHRQGPGERAGSLSMLCLCEAQGPLQHTTHSQATPPDLLCLLAGWPVSMPRVWPSTMLRDSVFSILVCPL